MPKNLLRPSDLFEITLPRRPVFSPDGSRVAYVLESFRDATDQVAGRLGVAALSSHDNRIFDQAGNVQLVRWETGAALIVLARHENGSKSYILRVNLERGDTTPIGSLEGPVTAIELSHGRTHLALRMTVGKPRYRVPMPLPPPGASWAPRSRYVDRMEWRADGIGEIEGDERLILMDLRTGVVTELTEDLMLCRIHPIGFSWSADDQQIFFSCNPRKDWITHQFDSQICAIDVHSRQMRVLTERKAPSFDPVISPDGAWIAYRGYDDSATRYLGRVALYVMRLDGSESRKIADVGQAIGAHAWEPDGCLIFSFVRQGRLWLARVDPTGTIHELADDLVSGDIDNEPLLSGCAEFSTSADGIAFVSATADDPGRITFLDPHGVRRYLHQPNDEWAADIEFGQVENLTCAAPDGSPVQAWLVLPPGYDSAVAYPLILDIHGGPHFAFGPHFSFAFQRFAAEGYIVLLPNYRGSAGADMAYYEKRSPFPGLEYDDLIAAVEAAISTKSVDSNRLFVTGQSAGGLLTSWIIGKTDRFAAAATQCPIINWVSYILTQDLYSSYIDREFDKLPWEDPMSYWRSSPLSLVPSMTTPTLIIEGELDCRTPPSEGIQLYQALRMRRVPAALLLIPEAFHASRRASQLIEQQQYILDWFHRHPTRALR